MLVLLFSILVILLLLIYYLKKKLRKGTESIPSTNPLSQPANFKYKIIAYSPNISNVSEAYGLFQKGKEYYIAKNDLSSIQNLTSIYPLFKGRPFGFITLPNNKFIIFSSDGKVYNPFTTSHNWRMNYLYLPNSDPLSVSGRPGGPGLFSGFTSRYSSSSEGGGGNILFRFYYTNYYIEEQPCVGNTNDPGTSSQEAKSCKSTRVDFPHPTFNVLSYYHTSDGINGLNAVSSDGWIYSLNNTVWTKNLAWACSQDNSGCVSLFGNLQLPDNLGKENKLKVGRTQQLVGADYEGSVPIFILKENDTYVLVDRYTRKTNLRQLFQSLNGSDFVIPARILDFTKAGPGDVDYLIAGTDGNLFGPSLITSDKKKSVGDFISASSLSNLGNLSGFTSVKKWISKNATSQYYLVFLFDTGKWFEIGYDIRTNTILSLGQTHLTSGLWSDWQHIKNVGVNDLSRYRVSSYGWSLFDTQSEDVYSVRSTGAESWKEMLYCSPNEDHSDIKSSSCVGLGKWKDSSGIKDEPLTEYKGFTVYSDVGTDTQANPGTVISKISLEKCLSYSANAIVYDESESDCHLYDNLQQINTFSDPTKATFIQSNYDMVYRNQFCIKHLPTGKYMFWDFTDPDNPKLNLNDKCIDNSIPDLNSLTPAQIKSLQQSLGAMWSVDQGTCLRNMNGVFGGDLQVDLSLGPNCNGGFTFNNNQIGNGTMCLNTDTSGSFNYSPCTPQKTWEMEEIPCPKYSTTGFVYDYCQS